MQRRFEFSSHELYHIYQRGIEKRKIFLDRGDYLRFLMLLYVCNSKTSIHLSDRDTKQWKTIFELERAGSLVEIVAYCLMPNHFHLLIYEKARGGISRFMQKLATAYSMYFNKKYTRTGGLFERPFKAQHVNDDYYLKYLFAYIHLNPVKITDEASWSGKRIANPATAKDFLNDYRFSSYGFYLREVRPENVIIGPITFDNYFPTNTDFGALTTDWINFGNDEELTTPVKATP
ncbi:MAG: transposase [Patescibacteria group bacterium]